MLPWKSTGNCSEILVRQKPAILKLICKNDCLARGFKNPEQFWNKIKTIIDTEHMINHSRADNTVLHNLLTKHSINISLL